MPLLLFQIVLILVILLNIPINALLARAALFVVQSAKLTWQRCLLRSTAIFLLGAPMIIGQLSDNRSLSIAAAITFFMVGSVIVGLAAHLRPLRAVAGFLLMLILFGATNFTLAAVLRATWIPTYTVVSITMSPRFPPGCRVVADRLLPPRRWDAVAIRPPSHPDTVVLSRLIALPGETVEIVDGRIRIAGLVEEPPASLTDLNYDGRLLVGGINRGGTGSPIKLGADEFFVLGDNSAVSMDSRFWTVSTKGHQPGTLGRAEIVGVVRLRYAPLRTAAFFR